MLNANYPAATTRRTKHTNTHQHTSMRSTIFSTRNPTRVMKSFIDEAQQHQRQQGPATSDSCHTARARSAGDGCTGPRRTSDRGYPAPSRPSASETVSGGAILNRPAALGRLTIWQDRPNSRAFSATTTPSLLLCTRVTGRR